MERLTKRQEDTLRFIKTYMVSHGFPPTVREIASELGLSSPATVQAHISSLADKGYIRKGNNRSRTIELAVKNEFIEEKEDVVEVPLLGKVTAGNPIEAIENPNEYFTLPAYLIPKNKEVFTLNVSGESMINAGILDGDIVIVEKRNTARNGEIVVAMTEDNEVTLKTYYKENGHFRLQPENDNMEPFIFDNIFILGKAIGLYRKI